MSDSGRQSFTDKALSASKILSSSNMFQPDSDQNSTEKLKDKIKGKSCFAASQAQPKPQKSVTQKIGDAATLCHGYIRIKIRCRVSMHSYLNY
ncbi:hypothetical protein BU17DRAFT_57981 [Hysterangium stoloniferum]|nr:hypothetical protein BU17DRAFT_57981 [Hysterangium stoloniferum]